MKKKTMLCLIILGLISIGASMYISSEVEEGKGKISRAESQISQGNKLFSLNPIAKEVGRGLTGGAQKKIDEGKEQVSFYESVAYLTRIGGIALLVIGVGGLIFGKKKK